MGPVAREVLGEPTEESKVRRELRFRTRGSLCISLDTGTWFDHELGKGGGVLAFVQDQLGVDKTGAIAWLRDRGHISEAPAPKANIRREVATYNYLSAEGELLFQVVRYEPKDFRQRRPNGNGGWIWKMDGVRKVIYRLPEVITAVAAGRTIFVAEGEKAVHALESIGLVGNLFAGWRGKVAAAVW